MIRTKLTYWITGMEEKYYLDKRYIGFDANQRTVFMIENGFDPDILE